MHRIVSLVITTLLIAGCLAPGEKESATPTPDRTNALPAAVYEATWNAPQDSPRNETFQLSQTAALDVEVQTAATIADWNLTIRDPDGDVAFRERCDTPRANCSVEPARANATYPAGTYRVEWNALGVGEFRVWVNATEPALAPTSQSDSTPTKPTSSSATTAAPTNSSTNATVYEARWRAPADSPKNVTFRLDEDAALSFASNPNGTLLSYNLTIFDPRGDIAFQDVCQPLAAQGCSKSVAIPASGTLSPKGTYRILWTATGLGDHEVRVTRGSLPAEVSTT